MCDDNFKFPLHLVEKCHSMKVKWVASVYVDLMWSLKQQA